MPTSISSDLFLKDRADPTQLRKDSKLLKTGKIAYVALPTILLVASASFTGLMTLTSFGRVTISKISTDLATLLAATGGGVTLIAAVVTAAGAVFVITTPTYQEKVIDKDALHQQTDKLVQQAQAELQSIIDGPQQPTSSLDGKGKGKAKETHASSDPVASASASSISAPGSPEITKDFTQIATTLNNLASLVDADGLSDDALTRVKRHQDFQSLTNSSSSEQQPLSPLEKTQAKEDISHGLKSAANDLSAVKAADDDLPESLLGPPRQVLGMLNIILPPPTQEESGSPRLI